VGLVLYGAKNDRPGKFPIDQENIFDRVTRRMRDWFREFF